MKNNRVVVQLEGRRIWLWRNKAGHHLCCLYVGFKKNKKRHDFGVYPQIGDKCPNCGAVVIESQMGIGR
jgi:hypothetical protein